MFTSKGLCSAPGNNNQALKASPYLHVFTHHSSLQLKPMSLEPPRTQVFSAPAVQAAASTARAPTGTEEWIPHADHSGQSP